MGRVKQGDPKEFLTPICNVIKDLKNLYPNEGIGKHLSMALADYGDFWGISDKELLFAIEKYKTMREMDFDSEESIDSIVRDGMNLDSILDEEDEDDDF